ncbi:TIGR03557 family F420-dependent LLM class oxidoreductase [Dermatobacter hominis]|uniref:TIGR03557 family F420-dependent LLM class oxidoreductase n=1 Tax=Dermatobacter hominis TaxID=2884263 RepID=UPI001D126F4B|nr:TIGR03557 family F420-dependent LLM class oxidoreductase [Dermatobacter hominis]UDY35179.1 TIGR03557 family F420-dependent LLM class oxidoreductase [Dermatobacter hominis]
MTRFGFTLSSEEHDPATLVEQARMAEDHGFDFVSISDHYHPWVTEQGHSGFVWSVLGALSVATSSLEVGVGVTCPLVRIHPAVMAQATATTSLMLGDRFYWGVGTGEALNEHILGHRWPTPEARREMLEEAIEVIRRLWTGDTVDHHGRYYTVENARIFDPPEVDVPIVVSGFGDAAVELAGRIGDGFWGHAPEREVIEKYEKSGGSGTRWAQVTMCWGPDEEAARETLHRIWPNSGLAGQLAQDLPTWTHFEQATSMLTVDQTVGDTPCGPDPGPVVESAMAFVDAGYDHVYFHQVGRDQEGFMGFWDDELRPALEEATPRR